MKVLALAHQYVPVRNAGAETMLHALLSALARRGHDVHASLSMQVGQPYEHDGVKVWPRQGGKANHFPHLPGTDILVGHLDNLEATAYLGHLNGIPVVALHHNTLDSSRRIVAFHGARIDLIVVNSQWMADDLQRWHAAVGQPQPRTIVVRPLVDRTAYTTTPGDRVTLVNLRRMPEEAGTLALSKGGETFWAVAARMPKTRFLGVTGAYGVQAPGDLPNVEIVEHVPADHMSEQVYARTRILLVPSSYESWGRVASEAICSGIPVVCSPTPGLQENLGPAGIYVDWRDVDGYVRALRTLAMPGPYAAASARALARAEEHDRTRIEEERRWVAEAERLGAPVGAR